MIRDYQAGEHWLPLGPTAAVTHILAPQTCCPRVSTVPPCDLGPGPRARACVCGLLRAAPQSPWLLPLHLAKPPTQESTTQGRTFLQVSG